MALFCAISGQVPEQPVVSIKSGHLFEKRLIEKYIREKGKCPITEVTLALEDLLPIPASTASAVKPRTAPATSIPGLLGLLHDEYDHQALETHTLRQHLHSVRQELCHALYQHDAATRVIARLMRERDEAVAALEAAKQTIAAEQSAKRTASEGADAQAGKRQKVPSIPDEVLQELQDVNAQLSKGRKKREISKTLATPDDLKAFSLLTSVPLHKTTQGGITQIEFNPENANVVATAGVDGTVQLFDHSASRQLGALEGHTKRVSGLQYVSGSTIITSSYDRTARIWKADSAGSFSSAATMKDHQAEVVGITLHPSKKYFVTASADTTWNFYDLEAASLLKSVSDESVKEGYTTVSFHPDGLILGTATDAHAIRIWEVRQQKNVASFPDHTGTVRSLSFSENGYYLGSAGDDGVKLWDLRKLKVLRTLTPFDDAPCNVVSFDNSGQYLGVGGADARVYNSKQDWSVVHTFPEMPKKGVLSLKFGPDAKTLFVGSADHNLRIFGTAKVND